MLKCIKNEIFEEVTSTTVSNYNGPLVEYFSYSVLKRVKNYMILKITNYCFNAFNAPN